MARFTLNHIGMAVPSIEKFLEEGRVLYESMEKGALIDNPQQKVREMFLTDGVTRIELLEPREQPSPLDSFLRKHRQGGVLHLAFDVDNLESALNEIEASGGCAIVQPTTDAAFEGQRIAFVMLGGHVVELIERKPAE